VTNPNARRIASMSFSVAPRIHFAYVFNITSGLWPCCSATHRKFFPIIRFQLTDEWRAL
jgi:hypothetical protein